MSKAIKPSYIVNRLKAKGEVFYHVRHNGTCNRIVKKKEGWYAKTRYFKTLRDAIIYCVFGH